jgi:hypothetical protein
MASQSETIGRETKLRDDPDIASQMKTMLPFVRNPLCRLAYPDDFAAPKPEPVPDFKPWFSGIGSYILESMQTVLRNRWLDIENTKGQIGDWATMLQRGRVQLQVLDAFTEAANQANRLDLTRFLLDVLSRLLTNDLNPTFWIGGLQGSGPPRLADRLETQRSAMALLRHAERFRQWEQRARTVGYFDEGYAQSKFWLGEWERFNGDSVYNRADQVLRQLEPL